MSETASTGTGISVRRDGAVLHVRFDRPEKRNAITAAMYAALAGALREAEGDPEIRAVLLSGAGEGFTAGNDLKDFLVAPPTGEDAPVVDFLRVLAGFRKILVAAVHGAAVGIGTTLLLHCDLVLAAPGARFQLPFVNLALVPEAASSLLLPRLVGHQRAAELFLLAEPFDTHSAHAMGLVNRIVERETLEAAALDIARRIAAQPAEAVLATKRLLKAEDGSVAQRMAVEMAAIRSQLASAEAREAIGAFFQPRA